MLGELRPEAATRGGLSHAALPSHKNPLEGVLLDDVLQRGVREVLVVEIVRIGHLGAGRGVARREAWGGEVCRRRSSSSSDD